MPGRRHKIVAVDLFCGAGGLSLGLKRAGIKVAAGVDLDPACEYPFRENLQSKFHLQDVATIDKTQLMRMWGSGINKYRLLAGCAPCQPFSSHRRGADTSSEDSWHLLSHFRRLTEETLPDFVTMENVTRLLSQPVFEEFVSSLRSAGYAVDYGTLHGPKFGLPQERRRLVLVASRLGVVNLPKGDDDPALFPTVRTTIGALPPLAAGETDRDDPLHTARNLSPINLERLRASVPGGTWEDWPIELRAACHQKPSGSTFRNFYGRMGWDAPSPTITTMSYNIGTGRFGHPEQDRGLTLREAAMLQGFPRDYKFAPPEQRLFQKTTGRLIGNAVPPAFGEAVGRVFTQHLGRLEARAA